MTNFDPRQPDNYAVHLANLDAADGAVANRDIHNQDGLLLVKKGFAIKTDTVKRLLNHKLVQPLETSVTLATAIDTERLFDDIVAMLRADKENQAIHQVLALDDSLRLQCQNFTRYPLLAQKLTVLSARLKEEYNKALFCGWFCLALATQAERDEETRLAAFIAGLIHDSGLLHIDPRIVQKTGVYSVEEWRALQSHSLIADTFLSYVENLPVDVRRATREHHERCDGSGYPAGLFGDKLCWLGQLVAVADTVWATSKKPSGRKVSGLFEVITLIKMNTAQHPENLVSGIYHLCRRADIGERVVPQQTSGGISHDRLLNMEALLRQRFEQVQQLQQVLPSKDSDRTARSTHLKLNRLWFIVAGSGLLSDSTNHWLRVLKEKGEQPAYDIYELSLMYNELQWQLVQLGRTLHLLLKRSTRLDKLAAESIAQVANLLAAPLDEKNVAGNDCREAEVSPA